MCEQCEEADPLREVYLARRVRMAQTWAPRRRWSVEAHAPALAAGSQAEDGRAPVAAE